MNSKALTVHRQKVLAVIALISVVAGFFFLQSYFILIAVSMILAYLFNPVYQWGLNKFNNKNGAAVSFTTVVLIFTVAIPLTALLYITVEQTIEIIDQIKVATANSGSVEEAITSLINSANKELDKVPGVPDNALDTDQVFGWLKEGASVILSSSVSFVKGFIGGIAGFFTNLIIFLFVFGSLLKNQKTILKALRDINPLGTESTDAYLGKMGAMTSAMVKGQFVIAIAQGLSGTISLWIAGMDYLAFWFVLLTFLSIIPLGGGIILIPFGIILILTGNIWQGALILAWHFLITTNIDNVLRPKFVPKSAKLDPALTILSVFAGIGIFGFLGIVLGPVIMIVIVTTVETFLGFKRTGKIQMVYEKEVKPPKESLVKRLSAKISARKSTPS